jgi:hypothetical protein
MFIAANLTKISKGTEFTSIFLVRTVANAAATKYIIPPLKIGNDVYPEDWEEYFSLKY